MKKQRGFTLIELMVVISLVALLLAWGIPAFSTWNARNNVEGEIAQLYSNLQYARTNAYANKNLTGIYWGGSASIAQYQIMTNTTQNATTIDTGASQIGATVSTAQHPLTATPNQKSVSFNGRGFLNTADSNDSANPITFYISPSEGAGTDCVSVSLTRIVSGKWDGTSCNPSK